MSLLTWTKEDFGTGVLFADNEHKTIFDLVNRTNNAVGESDQNKAKSLLADLIDYVTIHFQSEEHQMLRKGFEGLEKHKASHAKFVADCRELQAEGKAVTEKELKEAADWFTKHIVNEDRLYESTLSMD